jgi:uncharacterized phage-associated protein
MEENMSVTCFDVANYFIWLANHDFSDISDFSPMKLQKVTFIAQGWYLGLYGEPLFPEDFQAWKYGPVNPPLYYKHQKSDQKKIKCNFESPDIPFEYQKFILKIASSFFYSDASVLSGITHKDGSPWKVTRKGLSPKDNSNRVIPKDLIKDYYEQLINDCEENKSQEKCLAQFLDFLISDAEINFQKMIPYTKDMLERDRYLLEGVITL